VQGSENAGEYATLRPLTTLFCACLALAIALSILLRGRRAVHWLLAAFAGEVGLWWASQSVYGLFLQSNDPWSWTRVTAVLTVLLPQLAVRLFQAIVPIERRQRSQLPRVAAILGVPMLAIALAYPPQELDAPTWLRLVYFFYVFGLLVAALVSLWRRGRQSTSRAVRDRVQFLVTVGAAATAATLGDFLWVLGISVPPLGAVLSIVFLFILAESLARPRLADLYDMARRLVVATGLAFALGGAFYLFQRFIAPRIDLSTIKFNTVYNVYNAVLAAIVFLVLFEPLQDVSERRLRRVLFRERYDLETSVAELRRNLSYVLEIDEMVDTLLAGIERSGRATSCAIYLRDKDGDGYDLAGSVGEPAPQRIEVLGARPILDRLQKDNAVSLEEVGREAAEATASRRVESPITAAAAATLGSLRNAVLLAVKGDGDEIVGIVCVVDERVRDAFSPEEIALLERVAAQIGVAVANSRIYSRMKERDRLAALGAMAAGLAHEVKNPLGSIKGAAQLLEEGSAGIGAAESKEFIGIILEEVDRLNRVVGSFLDYARPHAGNPVPLDINGAVRRTVQILLSQKSEDIDVQLELQSGVPRAKIDPEQFRQVLINLIQNAFQALDGHGRILVSTALRRRGRSVWSGRKSLSGEGPLSERGEEELVEVAVRDSGPGISQNILKNLFVPFFTTKEQGTGLGLAISQSIVQNAGGTIDVQTQSGAGTTFTILLPAADEPLMTPVPHPAPTADEVADAIRRAKGVA